VEWELNFTIPYIGELTAYVCGTVEWHSMESVVRRRRKSCIC